jgi:hypothetical protein
MNKHFIATTSLALFISACVEPVDVSSVEPAAVADQPDPLPNIVLVLVDDMGFSDIGPYGSEVATPNLDTLAEGGMVFNQFRNTSKCFPTRAALMTGQYAQRVGMSTMPNSTFRNYVTLGDVLRQAPCPGQSLRHGFRSLLGHARRRSQPLQSGLPA